MDLLRSISGLLLSSSRKRMRHCIAEVMPAFHGSHLSDAPELADATPMAWHGETW